MIRYIIERLVYDLFVAPLVRKIQRRR
jgi:hypothetical protein